MPLMSSFADLYQKRNRPFDMILHLLQLDTPCLFMPCTAAVSADTESQDEPEQFKEFLTNFIHTNNLCSKIFDDCEILLVSLYTDYACCTCMCIIFMSLGEYFIVFKSISSFDCFCYTYGEFEAS